MADRAARTTVRIKWGPVLGGLALSGFGAWWASAGIAPLTSSPAPRIAILGAAVLLFAGFVRRHAGPGAPVRRIDGGWMAIATVGEVVLIGLGSTAAAAAGRPDLALPCVALAVGLHFFPVARAVGYRPYHVTGGAITVLALLSPAVPEPARTVLLGCGTAACLWLTIAAATLGGPRSGSRGDGGRVRPAAAPA